jgi:hypothetical protein
MLILYLAIALFFAGSGVVQSQEPPQAPRIESKEKSNDSPPAKENSKHHSEPLAPLPPVPLQSMTNIHTNKSPEDTKNSREDTSEFWPPFFGYRVKVTDSLLVFFTALLFAATIFLYRATRDLVTGAEETAERQLRAYVLVPRVDIVDRSPTLRFTETWVEVSITNFGHIPATSINYWLAVCAEEYPLRTALDPEMVTKTIGVLAPGGGTFIAEITTPLIKNSLASISDHGMALYVYGEVRYYDGFTTDRVTPFRYMRRSGDDWSRNGKLEMCQEGNNPN